jgi:YwiC-like protein
MQTDTQARSYASLIRPREHGSWSLALEPVVLSLIAVPSCSGLWLAGAVFCGFLTRRPLQRIAADRGARRTQALIAATVLGSAALLFLFGAVRLATRIDPALAIPLAFAGAFCVWLEARGQSRTQLAEVSGAALFGFLPALFVSFAGGSRALAFVLAALMMVRSVSSVVLVRHTVRALKGGKPRPLAGLFTAFTGFILAAACFNLGHIPLAALLVTATLLTKALVMAWLLRRTLLERASILQGSGTGFSPRSIGLAEAFYGIAYISAVGLLMQR